MELVQIDAVTAQGAEAESQVRDVAVAEGVAEQHQPGLQHRLVGGPPVQDCKRAAPSQAGTARHALPTRSSLQKASPSSTRLV